MLFHPASSFWRRRSSCRVILSSSAFWQRFGCSAVASWRGLFPCLAPSVMLNTLFFLWVRPCFPSAAVCFAVFHRGLCGLTNHSTRTGAIMPRQPVNSDVSPHFSLSSSVLFSSSSGAPVLIGSPLGLAQAARLSWLAGRCAFSPCVFVLASAQHLPLHPFFVGLLAALRLFSACFVARLVSLSRAFGYAEHIILSWGSSVLPFVRRVLWVSPRSQPRSLRSL